MGDTELDRDTEFWAASTASRSSPRGTTGEERILIRELWDLRLELETNDGVLSEDEVDPADIAVRMDAQEWTRDRVERVFRSLVVKRFEVPVDGGYSSRTFHAALNKKRRGRDRVRAFRDRQKTGAASAGDGSPCTAPVPGGDGSSPKKAAKKKDPADPLAKAILEVLEEDARAKLGGPPSFPRNALTYCRTAAEWIRDNLNGTSESDVLDKLRAGLKRKAQPQKAQFLASDIAELIQGDNGRPRGRGSAALGSDGPGTITSLDDLEVPA